MTPKQKSLQRTYVIYKFFAGMFFFSAVWLYFYRLYITDQQVGILDAIAFAIGLIAEVPSGALADRYGRARMVRAGAGLIATGITTQALGSSFVPFFIGQSIMMIGFSFVSGADDALFFEKTKFEKESPHWRKMVTRGSQAGLVAGLVATLVGGLLHNINPRLPWFTTAAAMLGSLFIILPLKDAKKPLHTATALQAAKMYVLSIKEGFAVFRHKPLRLYTLYIITVQGLFYVTGFGLLKPVLLDRFTFSPFVGSAVVALSSLVTVGILAIMHSYAHKMSEKQVLTTIGISAAAALLAAVFPLTYWGFWVILALYAGEHILHPFMSETINYHAKESQRATVLSVASFLKALPYVILAPVIGFLNSHDSLHYFLIAWSMLIMMSIILYISKLKKQAHISLPK